MEIDSFLDHIVGAKDVLLVKVNKKLNLGIPIEEIKLETDGRNDSNSDPELLSHARTQMQLHLKLFVTV